MKKTILILFLILPLLLNAYLWESMSPSGITAYNVCYGSMELICIDTGVMFFDGEEWVECSYGNLPVWGAIPTPDYPEGMIVVMGDGSDSDGIYLFTCSTQEFLNLYWLMNPRFIQYYQTGECIYAGGEEGLLCSSDGLTWEPVSFFEGMDCYAIACRNENLVVTTGTDTYYSQDGGLNWEQSEAYIFLSDVIFDQNGTLYGIYPDGSYSSGLWSSDNGGQTWGVEFWDTDMSSVWVDLENNIFVGWKEDPQGIAMYIPDNRELIYYNEGLPDFTINNIIYNPLINCNNIVACTNDGVYILTGYTVSSDKKQILAMELILYNQPNPFSSSTRIRCDVSGLSSRTIEIYNIKGQLIRSLLLDERGEVFWNGSDEQDIKVPTGIYLYKLHGKKASDTKKMILMR